MFKKKMLRFQYLVNDAISFSIINFQHIKEISRHIL